MKAEIQGSDCALSGMGSHSSVVSRSRHYLICLLRTESLAGRQVQMQGAWVEGDFSSSWEAVVQIKVKAVSRREGKRFSSYFRIKANKIV